MKSLRKNKDVTVKIINSQWDASMESLMKDALTSGLWAKLTPNACALYPVVLALANEAGIVSAKKSVLTELSGLAAKNVDKALEEIEAAELLTWDKDVLKGIVSLKLPVVGHYHPDGWWF